MTWTYSPSNYIIVTNVQVLHLCRRKVVFNISNSNVAKQLLLDIQYHTIYLFRNLSLFSFSVRPSIELSHSNSIISECLSINYLFPSLSMFISIVIFLLIYLSILPYLSLSVFLSLSLSISMLIYEYKLFIPICVSKYVSPSQNYERGR